MVITKKTAIKCTIKNEKEIQTFHYKNWLSTTKDSYTRMGGRKVVRHIENKQQNDRIKSLIISNNCNWKWIKLSSHNTEIGRMSKSWLNYMLSTRGSLLTKTDWKWNGFQFCHYPASVTLWPQSQCHTQDWWVAAPGATLSFSSSFLPVPWMLCLKSHPYLLSALPHPVPNLPLPVMHNHLG